MWRAAVVRIDDYRQQHTQPAMMAHKLAAKKARRQRKDLEQLLFHAVAEKECDVAERLLLKDPQAIKARTSFQMGVLHLAAAQGDVPMCELLLEYGADISQKDAVGATPLIHAAAQGNTDVVHLFIKSKAGANLGRQWLLQQATTGGETAVMAAAKHGHLDTLQALCAAGSDPSASNCNGITALLLACKHNRPAVVQHLVTQCKCSCVQTDSKGINSLMAAATGAATDVVALLLKQRQQWGLQLDATDAANETAIVYAARGGSAKVLQMLVDAGLLLQANWPSLVFSSAADAGNTQCFASRYQQLSLHTSSVASTLLQQMFCEAGKSNEPAAEASADGQNALTTTGLNAAASAALQRLQLSSEAGTLQTAGALDAIPAAVQCMSPSCTITRTAPLALLSDWCLDGGDALMYVAAESGSVDVAEWLLQKGIGSNCLLVADQRNAVFAAALNGHANMVLFLMQQGALLEPKDKRGRTPLAACAAGGVDDMVKLLVQLGADLLAQDHAGHVPRQIAFNKGHRSTAELLTQLAREKLMAPEWRMDGTVSKTS